LAPGIICHMPMDCLPSLKAFLSLLEASMMGRLHPPRRLSGDRGMKEDVRRRRDAEGEAFLMTLIVV
jgi:hypothetical protein